VADLRGAYLWSLATRDIAANTGEPNVWWAAFSPRGVLPVGYGAKEPDQIDLWSGMWVLSAALLAGCGVGGRVVRLPF
jgi:hypothetical protein